MKIKLGVPRHQIGTISSSDGRFEISVPRDTLVFFHVSYQEAAYPVTGPADDVLIVLREQELPPAVSIGGKTKEKYLVNPGMKVNEKIGGADFYRPGGGGKGAELGCIARTKKPFLIRDIQFTILDNHIPGCVASINVYRIEGEPETFVNVLHKPIYVNIIESDTRQSYSIQPEETILLEPGRYFIALQIVATDDEAVRKILDTPESERHPKALHMSTALYFKSSYEQDSCQYRRWRQGPGISVINALIATIRSLILRLTARPSSASCSPSASRPCLNDRGVFIPLYKLKHTFLPYF